MDQLSALLTPGTSSTPSCHGRKDQDYFEFMNKYFKVYNEVHFVYLTIFIFNLIVSGLAMVQDDYDYGQSSIFPTSLSPSLENRRKESRWCFSLFLQREIVSPSSVSGKTGTRYYLQQPTSLHNLHNDFSNKCQLILIKFSFLDQNNNE